MKKRKRNKSRKRRKLTFRQKAKSLYNNRTKHELLVSVALRLDGVACEEQRPMAAWIVDFYLPEHRVVIEIDGPSHRKTKLYDEWRTYNLRKHCKVAEVIRWKNKEVETKLDTLIADLKMRIAAGFVWSDPDPLQGRPYRPPQVRPVITKPLIRREGSVINKPEAETVKPLNKPKKKAKQDTDVQPQNRRKTDPVVRKNILPPKNPKFILFSRQVNGRYVDTLEVK